MLQQSLLLFYQRFIVNLMIQSEVKQIMMILNVWQQILVKCQTVEFTEHQTCELLA